MKIKKLVAASAAAALVAVVTGMSPAAALDRRPGAGAQQARIIGGSEVEEGDFPGTAAISAGVGPSTEFCTGTLIAPRWVVTAAHCVFPTDDGHATVHVGSTDRTSGEVAHAVAMYRHPDYEGPGPFDVGLIELDHAVDVEPAKFGSLPTAFPHSYPVIVTGWGRVCNGDEPECTADPIYLKYLKTGVETPANCRPAEGDYQSSVDLCIASKPRATPCFGDSGGPVWLFQQERWVLIGSISRGSVPDCGDSDTLATNLTDPDISGWIEYHLHGDS
ncbi:S1 family peptidase [Kitasatospora sp. NPDC008050]|uniref:S1 family peptidase n=1 Tax=Kitasatospora sp. NPDC008050 TaxID=3364021 RepID=UPI0036ED97EB